MRRTNEFARYKLMRNIIDALDQYEKDVKSKRIKEGLSRCKQQTTK